MTSFFRIHLRPALALAGGLAMASGIGLFRAQADEWNKRTILTVNEPIQITDTVLDPGQYVLRLADSNANRHVVQIFNANQTHLIDTVMAVPNYRLEPTGNSQFRFWETPPGTARALRAWFYPGDNFGQEFTYPKHPLTLEAKVTAPSSTVSRTEPARATPAPETATQPAPAPESTEPEVAQSNSATTFAEESRTEIAQNNAPAEPPATSSNPQTRAQEESRPQELPQTSSPYPMIGLSGGVLLALAGLLRLRSLA